MGSGHHLRMSSTQEERPGDDDLLEKQEGQGYGEDEGERDEALDSDS